jgi:hypothetical protein
MFIHMFTYVICTFIYAYLPMFGSLPTYLTQLIYLIGLHSLPT